MTTRRELLVAFGASALALPRAAFGQQQGKVWRVGFLADNARPASIDTHFHGAFARGMRELGYVEGKNLTIEWRYSDSQPERRAAFAAELAQMKVDVIVTQATLPTQAAQKATATIPLVFIGPGDPVGVGLVKSLARPGGNTTGLSSISRGLGPKRLELLLAMTSPAANKVSRVAMLVNPRAPLTLLGFEGVRAAGEKLGVAVQRVDASTAQEIDNAFAMIQRDKAGALMLGLNPVFEEQRDQLGQLSVKHRLPCMAPDRMYAEAGCLMSYGSSLEDMFRHAATYVDKIFKGRKPGDLPVEQPTKFELVINGKTAKALGLTIPQSLLISADKVIE